MFNSSLRDFLNRVFSDAITQLTGLAPEQVDPQVRPAGEPKFGDYQCNAAMGLAKALKAKPRELADKIKAAVEPALADVAEPLEVAGPGFLNIRLRDEFLSRRLASIPSAVGAPDRLGVFPAENAPRVLVDYSSPNIAKQMHVGHIRSTIIGDALARVLAFTGHEVIRQNHIGDWGTAIGMVVVGLWYIETRLRRGETAETVEQRLSELKAAQAEGGARLDELGATISREWSEDLRAWEAQPAAGGAVTLEQLELGYRFVQALLSVADGRGWKVQDGGGGVDLTAIPRLVTRMLQEGGEKNAYERERWKRARDISLAYCDLLYRRLGVLLTLADVRGESFYEQGDRLPKVVEEIRAKLSTRADGSPPLAELKLDQGALCLFQYTAQGEPRYRNADGDPLPMIIQKSDGAYLYATTDLAAIRYRIVELGARRLLYVVGSPQKLHLDMLFNAARAIGWAGPDVSLEHVAFGQILGQDRKLLRTRLGGTVKLGELLDEAERRAFALLEERARQAAESTTDDATHPMSAAEMREVARHVGIAAVKYFDLNRDRSSDYVFDWDAMLSLKGNTAPYMMYAYARIRSIYRKAAERSGAGGGSASGGGLAGGGATTLLGDPTERALALRLLRFPEAVQIVATELTPHVLCTYVYDLAGDFMRFYDACPVLEAPDETLRRSRLQLCELTARTLKSGLNLLGIEVIERM